MILVVVHAQHAVFTEGQSPINDADPVIGLGIVGLQGDVFLMVGLGFVKLGGIKRRAGHLEENGADAVNGAEVLGILLENFLEFIDGLRAEIHVFLRRRARDVLRGVSGGEIKTGDIQIRIEILGLLEVFDGDVVLTVLERLHALIQEVASVELGAARSA